MMDINNLRRKKGSSMKLRFLVVLAVLVLAASLVRAVPDVVIHRYSPTTPIKVDLTKNIDIASILGSVVKSAKNWVRDDAPWTPGKRILLMVGGFPYDGKPDRDGLVALASHYSKPRTVGGKVLPAYDVIYIAEYPKGRHIIETAAIIADIVNARCVNFAPGQKIDLDGHSMGGLICRAMIELPEDVLGTKSIGNLVGHLVMMGTPQYGFYEIDVAKWALGTWPEVQDMDAVGDFINKSLNRPDPVKVSTDYYAIIGTCSWRPKQFMVGAKNLVDKLEGEHDGLVSVNSSGYDLTRFCRSYKSMPFSLNHNAVKDQPEVFAQIDKWMVEDKWFTQLQPEPSSNQPVPDLNKPSQFELGPPKQFTYTGGAPILIGMNFNEVTKAMGRIPEETGTTGFLSAEVFRWVYGQAFTQNYATGIAFSRYEGINEGEKFKYVHWGWYTHSDGDQYLQPTQILPKEVLDQKPVGIYRCEPYGNQLAIVWYVNNQCFFIKVEDSRRQLYDQVKWVNENGELTSKICLNQNGIDFRNCDRVLLFLYVDHIPKIFGQIGNGGYAYNDTGWFRSGGDFVNFDK